MGHLSRIDVSGSWPEISWDKIDWERYRVHCPLVWLKITQRMNSINISVNVVLRLLLFFLWFNLKGPVNFSKGCFKCVEQTSVSQFRGNLVIAITQKRNFVANAKNFWVSSTVKILTQLNAF